MMLMCFGRVDYVTIMKSQLLDTQQFHLLGDAAYSLLAGPLVPFRDNAHLTPQQITYNTRHSSVRCTVERVFGRLKGKYRRLKDLDVTRTDYGPVITTRASYCTTLVFLMTSMRWMHM